MFKTFRAEFSVVCVYVHTVASVMSDSCDPADYIANKAPLSRKFFRQEYRSGLPCPSPEDLPDPGIKSYDSVLAGSFFTTCATWEAWVFCYLQPKASNGNRLWTWLLSAALHTCTHRCNLYIYTHRCYWAFCFGALNLLLTPNPSTPPNYLVLLTKHHLPSFWGLNTLPSLGCKDLKKEEGFLAGTPFCLRPTQDNFNKHNMGLEKQSRVCLLSVQKHQGHPMPQENVS